MHQNVSFQPISIRKPIDKSSPLLSQALTSSEILTCDFTFYRTSMNGGLELYYKIKLTEASIVDLNCFYPNSITHNQAQPEESVSFRFKSVTWEHVIAIQYMGRTELLMFSSPEETFEWYANELRKISELSARYFLDDPYCKQGYRSEINEVIRLIRSDFNIALYNNSARHQRIDGTRDWVRENIGSMGNWPDIYKYTEEIKLEYESEKLAYSQLRKASKELYNATRSYFGEGWVFYGDKSLDILGGVIQTAVGVFSYRIGKTIGSPGMKTSGTISMAYGGGRVYQGISDITYELTDGEINFRNDPVKFLIEQGAIALGGDSITAKKVYYDVDFVNNLYIGFGAFKIVDPKKRTETRSLPTKTPNGLRKVGFFERHFPDNVGFRIERWTSENYKRKLSLGNKPMLLYSLTASAIKLKLIIELHNEEN